MEDLYGKLEAYRQSKYYGFHMPGHKRNVELMNSDLPYGIDITEIEGFDDLHHAKGILKEGQERAAKAFGAKESFYLINGSTSGILSAILGSTQKGGKIIVSRNSHKSVYNAIFLNELEPIYLYPKYEKDLSVNGAVQRSDVEILLEKNPDVEAVVIVSPTYEGVVSDVQEIAKCVHERNIPLIIDEAHGAHLGFHSYFPENSNRKGADVVIHSVHKTLPVLTQGALLHLNGDLVDRNRIKHYLQIFQSSSPSYVLMSSIDTCIRYLEQNREQAFETYVQKLEKCRERLMKLKHLELINMLEQEPSKLVISVRKTNISSQELYDKLLDEYFLQLEMVGGTYVVAMTSIGDTTEGFRRLSEALEEIDDGLMKAEREDERIELPRPQKVYGAGEIQNYIGKMDKKEKEARISSFALSQSEGIIALEYAYMYPPGIPLIVPGEKISKEIVERFMETSAGKSSLKGLKKAGFIEGLMDG